MEIQKISNTQSNVKFSDNDGRQTVKSMMIEGEKFIVVGEQFIALADLDKWITAMQTAAKA